MEKKITLFHGSEKVIEHAAWQIGGAGGDQVAVCLFQSEI